MSISSLFGDDEHTAQEGPYSRLMKVRKWIFITGSFGLLVSFDLFDWASGPDWIQFIQIPDNLAAQAALAGMAYLAVVYVMLVGQAGSIYPIIMSERLLSRRTEELEGKRNKVSELRRELSRFELERLNQFHNDIRRLQDFLNKAEAARLGHSSSDVALIGKSPTELERIITKTRQEISELELGRISSNRAPELSATDEEMDLHQQLDAARHELAELASKDPGSKPVYRVLEAGIDVVRIAPPLAFAAWSLYVLWEYMGLA